MEKQDINGEHQGKPTLALVPKRKRRSKQEQSMPVDIKSESNMSREETDLATHVEICAIRYQGIQEKFDEVEKRLSKVETAVSDLKSQTQQGFAELKLLLERQNTSKQTTLITTLGAIVVAVISAIGYFIVKH
jgi:hypothetical protein